MPDPVTVDISIRVSGQIVVGSLVARQKVNRFVLSQIGNLCAAEKASLCEGYVTVCVLTLRDAPPQPLQNKGFAIYVTV